MASAFGDADACLATSPAMPFVVDIVCGIDDSNIFSSNFEVDAEYGSELQLRVIEAAISD